MASVMKRGKTWCVRYRVIDALGNVTQKRVSGYLTKEAAWEDARRLEAASNAGADVHGDRQSVGYIVERWFDEHVTSSTAKTTEVRYSLAMDVLAKFPIYNMPVRKLSPRAYTQLLEALREREPGRVISAVTARMYADPIRLSLSWAMSQGIIAYNPIQGYKMPRDDAAGKKARQTILNEDDIAALEKASKDKPIRIPLLLALYGGLRREEVAALQWDSVDLKARAVHITAATARTAAGDVVEKSVKSSSSARKVILPAFVVEELRVMPRLSPYVCVTPRGDRYNLSSYRRAVERLAGIVNAERENAGKRAMPVPSFHDLRHTHAAMLIRKGVQPKIIQERLGHASIKITMDVYGYLMTGLQEGVGDVLDELHDEIHNFSKKTKPSKLGTKVGTRTRKSDEKLGIVDSILKSENRSKAL